MKNSAISVSLCSQIILLIRILKIISHFFLNPVHTSLDDGALFDQLDFLEGRSKFVVFGCALTLNVALFPDVFLSMLIGSVHSTSTEDGLHNHSIGADFTLFGSHLGSNFMALPSQVSFGHDLKKFKSSEHLHLHADYA